MKRILGNGGVWGTDGPALPRPLRVTGTAAA
jgi:hypothetical protein